MPLLAALPDRRDLPLGPRRPPRPRGPDELAAGSSSTSARSAERLNPLALPPRYLQASALESLGRRPAARRELLAALDREPKNFVTMALLGDLETRAGRPSRARAWYRRALALNPIDVGLRQLAAR